jgi:(p)ppGpp synthase/HD superfamily hydrolase
MLHDITAVLAEQDVSMVSIQATSDAKANTANIRLGVEVRDLLGLATLLDRIRRVNGVARVQRRIEA